MNALLSILLALATASGWPLAPTPTVHRSFEPPAIRWSAGHRGVDLDGTPGQPVLAAEAGAVTFAGRLAGRGVVVISHGDTRTTYEPVAADVHAGEAVEPGQRIGTLELLGSHCFPDACLHWGLVRGREYLDPLALVGGRAPVRLLPLDPPVVEEPGTGVSKPPQIQAALDRLSELMRNFRASLGLTPEGAPAGRPAAAGP